MKMIIKLKEEIDSNLIFRLDAEQLFNKLKKNSSKVVMDFNEIEFINRSFAQSILVRNSMPNMKLRKSTSLMM